jgi:multiple sugar transport system ATP-binding protein
VTEDEKLFVDAGVFRVQIPANKVATFKPYAGKPVIFGIRPEDIHDPNYIPANITEARVKAEIDVTELMGNEVFVYYNTGGKVYIGRVDPRTSARVGQQVEASFNMDNMHIFDRETEEAIR